MRIHIDTDVDTFEAALQAVHGAYGRPYDSAALPTLSPNSSAPPGEIEVEAGDDAAAEDYYPGGWTRRKIRQLAEMVEESAAEALRYMAENAPAADIDDALAHMAEYTGIDGFSGQHMGGRMSSVGHARNSIKGNVGPIYETDYRHRKYRMDKGIAKVLLEEFAK